MKKYILQFIILTLPILAFSQQEFYFSQFINNKLAFNPAYAGSAGATCISAIHRQQWIGLEGAPTTQALSLHGPLFGEKVGIGLTVMHDQIGYYRTVTVNGIYAYRIVMDKSVLSLGVQASYRRYSLNESEVQALSGNDPVLGTDFSPFALFNFGAGVWFETKKIFIGASIPRLMRKGISTENRGIVADLSGEQPHLYLMAGSILQLSKKLKLRPSTLVKFTENAPIDFDVNLSLGLLDKFWIGCTYRFSNSGIIGDKGTISALIEFQATPQLKIAGAYDYHLAKLNSFHSGSYEVMLQYCLVKDGRKVHNPRFF